MSNILSLQQIPTGTTIAMSSHADFNDQFYVAQPNYPSSPLMIIGTLTAGSITVTNLASVNGLVLGMPVIAPAIPPNTRIASISVGTLSMTLNNPADTDIIAAQLTIMPPPLDLTGIIFSSTLRKSITDLTVLFQMTSAVAGVGANLMTNTGQLGTFGWAVLTSQLPSWPPSLITTGQLACVMDIQATDALTNTTVNLCAKNGPIPVTVNLNITR